MGAHCSQPFILILSFSESTSKMDPVGLASQNYFYLAVVLHLKGQAAVFNLCCNFYLNLFFLPNICYYFAVLALTEKHTTRSLRWELWAPRALSEKHSYLNLLTRCAIMKWNIIKILLLSMGNSWNNTKTTKPYNPFQC